DFKSSRAKTFNRLKNRLVLDLGADDMKAPPFSSFRFESEDCDIVALGGTAGENDLVSFGIYDTSDLIPRLLNCLFCTRPVLMRSATSIPEFLSGVLDKSLGHTGIDWGRGIAVQISGHSRKIPDLWFSITKRTFGKLSLS